MSSFCRRCNVRLQGSNRYKTDGRYAASTTLCVQCGPRLVGLGNKPNRVVTARLRPDGRAEWYVNGRVQPQ